MSTGWGLGDAATGARLRAHGLGTDPLGLTESAPQLVGSLGKAGPWNASDWDVLAALHRADVAAGAQWVCAATFGLSLQAPRGQDVEASLAAMAKLVRTAAGAGVPVMATLGPPADLGLLREQAHRCAAAGASMIALETFTDVTALENATRTLVGFSVLASLCPLGGRVQRGGSSLAALNEEDGARLVDAGAAMVGVNCGDGLVAMLAAASLLLPADRPVVMRPSAGLPQGDPPTYPVTAGAFASVAEQAWRQGIHWVGGCCGAGPAHLEAAALVRREADPHAKRDAL